MKRNGCKIKINGKCYNRGYNSHGHWSTLGEIEELELERGNRWPNAIKLPRNSKAIWITVDPHIAAWYCMTSQDEEKGICRSSFYDQLHEIKFQKGDEIIHTDEQGGYVLVRK